MFFQVDDQFQVNPKQRALAERTLDGDLRGFAALGLWTTAGSLVQAAGQDGVVARTDLIRVAYRLDLAEELAHLLVDAGLWHAPGHGCDRCPPVAEHTWIYHDWFAMGYDTGEQVKTNRAKRKELKDAKLVNSVWARDSTEGPGVGACRYCGKKVVRADKKGDGRWELDHVDPTKALGGRNVVLACIDCNRRKGNRTPEQAGMKLNPPPRQHDAGATAVDSPGHAPAAGSGTAVDSPGPVPAAGSGTGSRHQTATRAQAASRPPGRITDPISDPIGDRSPTSAVPARATRAHAGQGGSGGGSGQVSGEVTRGPGQGQAGSAAPARRRRRRSRGKSKQPTTPPAPQPTTQPKPKLAPEHDAGHAPDVPTPGRFGSPWHGWTGPPSTVHETTCHAHGQEKPCRLCITPEGTTT